MSDPLRVDRRRHQDVDDDETKDVGWHRGVIVVELIGSGRRGMVVIGIRQDMG